jgi:hypothetical protein
LLLTKKSFYRTKRRGDGASGSIHLDRTGTIAFAHTQGYVARMNALVALERRVAICAAILEAGQCACARS